MRIERRRHSQENKTQRKCQYCENRANILKQHTCKHLPQRSEAVRDQAKTAVYTSLQLVWNKREPVLRLCQREFDWLSFAFFTLQGFLR